MSHNKRAVIFANGELRYPAAARAAVRPGDLLIAADGGARHCFALGFSPALLIGDFDSLSQDEIASLGRAGAQLIQHPARKDETDLELALLYANQISVGEVLVLAGLGARWDQTLGNLLLVAHPQLRGLPVSFLDGDQRIYPLRGETQIEGQPNDIVSLIPIGGDVTGVTTEGLEYPLRNETLYFGATRGVSNTLLGKQARVALKEGLLLCIVSARQAETDH